MYSNNIHKLLYLDVVVAPPYCYLSYVASKITSQVKVAAQNCYKVAKGAYTGEIRYISIDLTPTHLLHIKTIYLLLDLSRKPCSIYYSCAKS